MEKYLEKLLKKYNSETLALNRFGGLLGDKKIRGKNLVLNSRYLDEFLSLNLNDAIPFKGISLILKGFYNIYEREMNDLDIFISPEKFKKAEKKILIRGFKETKAKKRCWYEKSFIKDGILKIDLHKNFFLPHLYGIKFKDIEENTVIFEYRGKEIKLLEDSVEFFLISLSIINNSFNVPLINYYDLIKIYKYGKVDTSKVFYLSKKCGVKRGISVINSILFNLFEEKIDYFKLPETKKVKKLERKLHIQDERKGFSWRKREFEYKFSLIKFSNVLKFLIYYLFSCTK